MADKEERRQRMKFRWLLLLAALALVLMIIVGPPLLSIGRYKSRITQLVSSSLGRPVRLSSVELRLFPRPGFVLTDLTVDEDSAYGAEPLLHANTVTAAIRLFSLWRGRLEISGISVDEASLNLVRTADGRWNLDPFLRTAAARTNGAAGGTAPQIPYLEATNSRVNIKRGLEKLPFSLVNADLSFWQENPGDWRLRLRGQPARTDVNLDLADTGIVRLEATLRHAPDVQLIPIHMEMEWREAQLGQLSRLIVGSDPGWRGDLTGQLQLDGTADTARVKTRLSATNVHRIEFTPADPVDFDANCSFVYHYSKRSVENLACDSPLGDGHIKVAGDLPAGTPPKLSVELQRIPVGAGLDILRTLRNGIDPNLEAKGTLSGQIEYDPDTAQRVAQGAIPKLHRPAGDRLAKGQLIAAGPLKGSLAVDGFELSGGGLAQPIQAPRMTWIPESEPAGAPQTLATTVSLAAGGTSPITLAAHLSRAGYVLDAHGPVGLARLRELAPVAGIGAAVPTGMNAESATIDLVAEGTWLPTQAAPSISADAGSDIGNGDGVIAVDADRLRGTVTLHNATWKSEALANDVEVSDATMNLNTGRLEWNPVSFQYGPIRGTASLETFPNCEEERCAPKLELRFSDLDASALQAALLGARKQDSAFASLVARFTQNRTRLWPKLDGTIRADSILLGPVQLQNASIAFRVLPASAELTSIDGGLLGGDLHATGRIINADKPVYSIEGTFSNITGQALCHLLELQCGGGPIDGKGKVELSGFAATELAASASGTVYYDWRHGSVNGPSPEQIPKELSRFDRWIVDGTIANGTLTLSRSSVQRGAASSETEATVTFGNPPTLKVRAVTEGDAAQK
jgi:uncharacterized protein involved in outer membrane biogenesis